MPKTYKVGDKVLCFNSRLRIFPGKLKTKWSGPFTVVQIFPQGAVELLNDNNARFRVNGHRLKKYYDMEDPNEEIRATWHLDAPRRA